MTSVCFADSGENNPEDRGLVYSQQWIRRKQRAEQSSQKTLPHEKLRPSGDKRRALWREAAGKAKQAVAKDLTGLRRTSLRGKKRCQVLQ